MGTGLVSILILQCIVGEKYQQWRRKTPTMAKLLLPKKEGKH